MTLILQCDIEGIRPGDLEFKDLLLNVILAPLVHDCFSGRVCTGFHVESQTAEVLSVPHARCLYCCPVSHRLFSEVNDS